MAIDLTTLSEAEKRDLRRVYGGRETARTGDYESLLRRGLIDCGGRGYLFPTTGGMAALRMMGHFQGRTGDWA